jgi:type IV pilus assembly protein PilC
MALDLSAIRATTAAPALSPRADEPMLRLRRRVGTKALAIATRQLAVMLGAGLPIVRSLQLLVEQAGSGPLRRTLHDITRRVEAGSSLGDAAAAHPDVFPPLYLALVRTGELGGVLEAVLHRLGAYLEQSARLRRTVVGALVYPAVVVSAAVVVTAVLLGWVVPIFAGVFASVGAELPAATRLVLALSSGLRAHALALATIGLVIGGAAAILAHGEHGARLRDRWLLRVPGLGDLFLKAAVARTARTLGTLITCGVAILDALDIAARTAGNRVVEDAFARAGEGLERGRSLALPLAECPEIPSMVRQMIAVGETTGTLDVMLARMADCYDEEVQAAAATLLALLEPALILFLGVVVGGLVVSMYLPIFRLGAVLG